MQPQDRYTYETAGFNGFLTRSLKSNPLANNLSDGIASSSGTAMNFDRQQVAGSLGNKLTIGRLILDGVAGRAIAQKNGEDVAWFGDLT